MANKYSMNDVRQFLLDYRSTLTVKPKGLVAAIPIVGSLRSQKAALDEQKRLFYENEYMKVLAEGTERQDRFIAQMTPVIDEFYAEKVKKKTKH